jgi:hypothetical protein
MTLKRYGRLFILSLFSGAFMWCSGAQAESGDDNRYEMFRDEDGRYRFDRKTGEVEKMEKIEGGGIRWVKQSVEVSKQPSSGTKPRSTPITTTEVESTPKPSSFSHLEGGKKPGGGIRIFDKDDKDITEDISDDDRRNALPDIARYEKDMSISLTTKSGDRITGVIMAKNKGDRRIQRMELTLSVPVIGKEKPEDYRFVFADSGTPDGPLQPAANGVDGRAWMQPVNVPSPAGGVKGNADLKISYIKFYDK